MVAKKVWVRTVAYLAFTVISMFAATLLPRGLQAVLVIVAVFALVIVAVVESWDWLRRLPEWTLYFLIPAAVVAPIYVALNVEGWLSEIFPPPAQPAVTAPAPIKAEEIEVRLHIDSVKGDDASGRFVITNTSDQTIEIGDILQQVPLKFGNRIADDLPRTIRKRGGSLPIPLNSENALAKILVVRLQFDYYPKEAPANTGYPYLAQFELSSPLQPGDYAPTACCERNIDIRYAMDKETARIFEEDTIGRVEFTLLDNTGVGFITNSDQSRQFFFNPAEHEALLTITQDGRQRVYRASVSETPERSHRFEVRWNVKARSSSLRVDGVEAKLMKDGVFGTPNAPIVRIGAR